MSTEGCRCRDSYFVKNQFGDPKLTSRKSIFWQKVTRVDNLELTSNKSETKTLGIYGQCRKSLTLVTVSLNLLLTI